MLKPVILLVMNSQITIPFGHLRLASVLIILLVNTGVVLHQPTLQDYVTSIWAKLLPLEVQFQTQ